jgi:hypothetical protein
MDEKDCKVLISRDAICTHLGIGKKVFYDLVSAGLPARQLRSGRWVAHIDVIDGCTGKKSEVRFEESRFGDLKYFVCDISRARDQLDWQPRVKPGEGVPLLISWIQENRFLFIGGDR